VPTVYGQQAFVPAPLPPKLDIAKVALNLASAMRAIGELRGASMLLANPHILIRPLQRLEAQTSSAMEGTFTTTDDLVMAEANLAKSPKLAAIEVNNYSRALEWSVKKLAELPLSARLFKGAHKILLDHVGSQRGQNRQPGEFARDQNMIGGASIEAARFIPPPPAETVACMSALEKYLNRGDKNPAFALIDMALVHYQFETIHPFADGNGRVGRMLISIMAVSEGLLERPVLYVSPELEQHKDTYIDLMYDISSKGAWEAFVGFFLDIVTQSCRRSIDTIHRILDLQQRYQEDARARSRSSNMTTVIDMLFDTPFIRPRDIVEKTGITDAAARNLLRQLTEIGIIVRRKQFYPTIWVAEELLEVSRPK